MFKRTSLMLAITACLTPMGGQAQESTEPQTKSYYQDAERGWYWYEQLPEEEKEKFVEKLIQEQPNVIPEKPNAEKKAQISQPKDKPLSNAWFRANFQSYVDAAIDNPYDIDAMRTYLYLEKFMRDRATAFGYERQKAVYNDPFLDASSKRPTANFGMKTMSRAANNNRDALLQTIGDKSGIFFFYRSDCPYCKQQAPLLRGLEREFGFEIKPISLDGQPLPNNPWESFLTNQGQAEQLGVAQVPAMYIYNPDTHAIELIAQGLQSLPQLKKRVLMAAERADLITHDQYSTIIPTGLYSDVKGDIIGHFPMPANAPDTFKHLYEHSLEAKQ